MPPECGGGHATRVGGGIPNKNMSKSPLTLLSELRSLRLAAKHNKLSWQAFTFLLGVKERNLSGRSITVVEAAQLAGLEAHSAGELARRLEKSNLLERHRCGTDNRKVLISVTQSGSDVLATIMSEAYGSKAE